jgi:hypothetical protein
VLTGEYGGMAGFRHVTETLRIDVGDQAKLVFQLVQLCAPASGKSLTDDELRLIAAYPRELSLLYPLRPVCRSCRTKTRGKSRASPTSGGFDHPIPGKPGAEVTPTRRKSAKPGHRVIWRFPRPRIRRRRAFWLESSMA